MLQNSSAVTKMLMWHKIRGACPTPPGNRLGVALGQIMAFTIQHGPFVQVLHSPLGNHWIAIECTEHNEVKVYDNLYPSNHKYVESTNCVFVVHTARRNSTQPDGCHQTGGRNVCRIVCLAITGYAIIIYRWGII